MSASAHLRDELPDDGGDHGGIGLVGHVGMTFQHANPGFGDCIGSVLGCRSDSRRAL